MKPLDRISNSVLSDENARRLLSDSQYKAFCAMSGNERVKNLRELLLAPIGHFTVINELYFRSKWSELFEKFYGNNPFVLLEFVKPSSSAYTPLFSIVALGLLTTASPPT